MKGLLKILIGYHAMTTRFNIIKSKPEKCAKSVSFGITSIILSLLSFASSFFALMYSAAKAGTAESFVLLVFGVLLGVVMPLGLFTHSITHFTFQIRLNKNWATWTALGVLLASILASVVVIFFGFTSGL